MMVHVHTKRVLFVKKEKVCNVQTFNLFNKKLSNNLLNKFFHYFYFIE